LKDLNVKTIPGYERVNNLLDRIANKLKNKITVTFQDFNGSGLVTKVAAFHINDIDLADLSGEDPAKFILHISQDITIDGLTYHLVMPINEIVNVKFTQDLNIPINIDKDVTVDLSSAVVNTPTIVVTTDISNGSGGTTLVVPVEDTPGHVIGNANIDLNDINVIADATLGAITLNGTTVAHLTFNDNVGYTLSVDENIPVTFNIDKWINFGDGGGTTKTFTINIDYDIKDFAENILGVAQDKIMSKLNEAQAIVDEVNNLIAKINSYEDKLTNTIDSYIDRIKGYLDKINSLTTGLINSTNSRFQPFMVASTSKGLKRLSGAKNYPTNLGKDITLYPTSQTFELFVPMARKHVAVTNVFSADLSKSAQDGDSDCKSKLTAANTGKLNTVVDGTVREMKLSGLVSGYVYEIAYSALDFHGKIATRKYYVTVE
jgi:sugar-specific transcriptional regulator TrmB